MTDPQTAALQALLTRVEAGDMTPPKMIVDAFGVRRLSNGWDVIALVRWIEEGGLEAMGAAKALHEAVLPGWGWVTTQVGANVEGPTEFYSDSTTNPARAWLICILRALIATPADTEGR